MSAAGNKQTIKIAGLVYKGYNNGVAYHMFSHKQKLYRVTILLYLSAALP